MELNSIYAVIGIGDKGSESIFEVFKDKNTALDMAEYAKEYHPSTEYVVRQYIKVGDMKIEP